MFFVKYLLRSQYFSTGSPRVLMPRSGAWSDADYFVIWQKLIIFTFYLKAICIYSLKVAHQHYLYYNQHHIVFCAIQRPTFSDTDANQEISLIST